MTRLQHQIRAEEFASKARKCLDDGHIEAAMAWAAVAQVHATLAVATITAGTTVATITAGTKSADSQAPTESAFGGVTPVRARRPEVGRRPHRTRPSRRINLTGNTMLP